MVALGAVLLVASVAGFIIVPEHKPHRVTVLKRIPENPNGLTRGAVSCTQGTLFSGPYCNKKVKTLAGLSQTLYDALRITTWAVLIVGALLVAIGLIRYARLGPRTPG